MKASEHKIQRKPCLAGCCSWQQLSFFSLDSLLLPLLKADEAGFAYTPQVKYDHFEPRNEIWGKNFPMEYQLSQTSDTDFRSKYNGSAMIDMLEVDPRLVVLWAGYGFSKDYNQGRGHYYAVTDIRNTLRTGAPMDDKKVRCPIPAGPARARMSHG